MYKLLIEDDEGGQTAVSLIRDEITIGRKEGNTIRLTDRNVSRRHGRIVREDDRVFVEDVAARYGIKKNGSKIDERAELQAGDVVVIGDYRLTLKADQKADKKKPEKKKKKGIPKPKKKGGAKAPPEKPKGLSDDFSDGPREETQIMQAMPAKLVVISSNFAGKEFPLAGKELVVGRGDDCNIIIDHRSISSRHAKIVREDNTTYKIVDLNSKNGVKVSGETYRATLLKRGDVIELGHVKFRFVEPGENYVFDPKAVEKPAPSLAVSKSDSGLDTKTMGLVVAAVVAAVLVVGAVVVMGNGDDDVPMEGLEEDTIAEIDEIEEQGDEGIEDAIAQARAEIESGELTQPVTRLETISSVMDLSSDQQDRLDELLSKARNEQPFKRHYQNAVDNLESGEALAALNEATSIPRHSIFHARLEEEGLLEKIFDETLAVGYASLENEDLEAARNMADEVLMAGAEYDPAIDLHDAIDDKQQQIEAARAEEQARHESAQASASASSGGGTAAVPSQPSPSPSPSAGSGNDSDISDEEARSMYTQAARHVAGGNPQEAISVCQQALDAGHIDCHRILGLAYSRLDDSDSACRHFEAYLATGPANPGPVESQMDNHGCSP